VWGCGVGGGVGGWGGGGEVWGDVSCGAEAWTLTKKEEQGLLIFERKIFRRIYGPKYENG